MSPRVPSSTYRLQLSGVGLERARELVEYLYDLGVSDLYASPVLQAGKGSTHGYDVTDPNRVHSEIGDEEDLLAMMDALRERGMGLLLDIVPNHMASTAENPWWRDVHEHGQASPYAGYFDIHWRDEAGAPTQLMRPVLGDRYGVVLEAGQLQLGRDERGLHIGYFERRLPLDPSTYPQVLASAAARLSGDSADALRQLSEAFSALPDRTAEGEAKLRRRRSADDLRQRLATLLQKQEDVRQAVDDHLRELNGTAGDPASFDSLDELLLAQPYRLAFWRLASRELNYRRFFDIAELVGVRVELPEVFEATHRKIMGWVDAGRVTGLRIDHVDGLRDPTRYLADLQKRLGGDGYVVVEKILGRDEAMPDEWRVAGTTGYEFAVRLTGLYVDPVGLRGVDRTYGRVTGIHREFAEIVYRKKKQIMDLLFIGETESLADELRRLARDDRHARDLTTPQLQRALVEVTACLQVYRTYIRSPQVAQRDRRRIEDALAEAKERLGGEQDPALDFLGRVLRLESGRTVTAEHIAERLDFVLRWQQTTGPVMAKGLEDSALYVYTRLASLNEVGGEPGHGATSVPEMHEWLADRRQRMPATLNASSTHDTKRSEDVRARISVLSELDHEWRKAVRRWHSLTRRHRERVGGRTAPDANEEYLVYQTLLGAWPLHESEKVDFPDRVAAYLVKALREAREHSSWLNPDEEYEAAVQRFARNLIGDEEFLASFRELERRVAFHGAINALSQLAIKATAPGVPDFYQGTELWDLSLVDPDNRREVDFERRREMLQQLDGRDRNWDELRREWRDGSVKLLVTSRALRHRREHKALYRDGSYVPLRTGGRRRAAVFGFAREHGGEWSLTLTPIRSVGLVGAAATAPLPDGNAWRATGVMLPEGAPEEWTNVLTRETVRARGGRLRLRDAFGPLPLAILSGRTG